MKIIGIKEGKLNFTLNKSVFDIMKNIGRLESNNHFKLNRESSAKGKYQIIDQTFKRIVKYYSNIIDNSKFKSHTIDNDDSVMLLLLNYYREKIKNVPLDLGICYLAHFLGAERANYFVHNPNTVVINKMTECELKWNAKVFRRFNLPLNCTAQQFIDKINSLEKVA